MTKEELRYELIEDQRHEELMEKDYDYFLDSIEDDIRELLQAVKRVRYLHSLWGHEFNIEEYNIIGVDDD